MIQFWQLPSKIRGVIIVRRFWAFLTFWTFNLLFFLSILLMLFTYSPDLGIVAHSFIGGNGVRISLFLLLLILLHAVTQCFQKQYCVAGINLLLFTVSIPIFLFLFEAGALLIKGPIYYKYLSPIPYHSEEDLNKIERIMSEIRQGNLENINQLSDYSQSHWASNFVVYINDIDTTVRKVAAERVKTTGDTDAIYRLATYLNDDNASYEAIQLMSSLLKYNEHLINTPNITSGLIEYAYSLRPGTELALTLLGKSGNRSCIFHIRRIRDHAYNRLQSEKDNREYYLYYQTSNQILRELGDDPGK